MPAAPCSALLRVWCAPGASPVRPLWKHAEWRASPTIPVVLDPPAQSAVPFPRVRFECEIDPYSQEGSDGNSRFGRPEVIRTETQYLQQDVGDAG